MGLKRIRFYSSRCTGCRLCEAVCTLRHTGACSREAGRIRLLTHEKPMAHRAVFCHHCARPVCAELCPVDAIYRDDTTATVKVDSEKCFGCGECLGCPLGGMFLDKSSGQAAACDLCGGDPACVKLCPFGALEYADDSRQAIVAATPARRALERQATDYPKASPFDALFRT